MRLMKRAVLVFTVSLLGAGGANAQNQQPAEFPPSSYKGKQYVDSKGCVFIRAGIDGDVSWIPRVTRDRKIICGFAPSLARAPAPAPEPAPQKVEQITLDAPAPAPAPKPVAAPAVTAVAAAPAAQAQRPVAKPRPVVVRQVAPAPKKPKTGVRARAATPKATAQQIATACPGASPVGQRYLRKTGKVVIRCGPQTARIVPHQGHSAAAAQTVKAVDPNKPISVSQHRRIVPRHVAQNRVNTTNVRIPHGYKAAWQDDRLNPKRAEQTLAGRHDMLLVWTNTVPRRLIDRSSGKDVTVSTPLVYPYIDQTTQRRELGEVTIVRRNGKVYKRIARKRQPVISTRSAPKAQAPAAAPVRKQPAVGQKRYVQIGYFTTKAKASKAAQHLAGLGMQSRIGKVRKGGKSYLAVQAGPFGTAKATQSALKRLRGVGYTGAAARN